MAILFMDGFDHYSSVYDKGYVYTSEARVITSIYRNGSGCLFSGDYGRGRVQSGRMTAATTYIVGFAFRLNRLGEDHPVMSFSENGTTHVDVRIQNATRKWVFTRNGTVLGTSTELISIGAWHYIELKATVHSSTGSYELRQDGATILSGSGLNTRNGGTGIFNEILLFWSDNGDNGNLLAYMDDLYLCDNSGSVSNNFLGDTRVEYLAPTGAGVRTQFTPSSGSNWQNVDEKPASDADYNSNNSPGAMDLFTMADLAGNGLVRGVQTISRAKKDDAGFRKAEPVFYKASGLGDTARFYKGSKYPVLDNFSNLPLQVFSASPDTGVAWTVDEVNNLQYGYAVGDAGMFTLDAKVV